MADAMLEKELRQLIKGWKRQADLISQILDCSNEARIRERTLRDCVREVEYLLKNCL